MVEYMTDWISAGVMGLSNTVSWCPVTPTVSCKTRGHIQTVPKVMTIVGLHTFFVPYIAEHRSVISVATSILSVSVWVQHMPITTQCDKMAVKDIPFCQCAGTEFLAQNKAWQVHQINRDACIGASSVRRQVKHFHTDTADLHAVADQKEPQLNATNSKMMHPSKRTEG
jgi:hypothetical protein